MLADAEEKNLRLEELKKVSSEENLMWGGTVKGAAGERINDGPGKLRK